jgi:hypothetical protein
MEALGARAKIVGRWIALAPAAALAAFITPATVKYLNQLVWDGWFLGEDSFLGHSYSETLAGLAAGAVFVYLGARIAPYHRQKTAITLAVVALFLTGSAVFADLVMAHYWLAWQGACAAMGAWAMAQLIARGEINLEPIINPTVSVVFSESSRERSAGAPGDLAQTQTS